MTRTPDILQSSHESAQDASAMLLSQECNPIGRSTLPRSDSSLSSHFTPAQDLLPGTEAATKIPISDKPDAQVPTHFFKDKPDAQPADRGIKDKPDSQIKDAGLSKVAEGPVSPGVTHDHPTCRPGERSEPLSDDIHQDSAYKSKPQIADKPLLPPAHDPTDAPLRHPGSQEKQASILKWIIRPDKLGGEIKIIDGKRVFKPNPTPDNPTPEGIEIDD